LSISLCDKQIGAWKTALLKASIMSSGVSAKTLMLVCYNWFASVSDEEWKAKQRRFRLRCRKTSGKKKYVAIEDWWNIITHHWIMTCTVVQAVV